VLLPDVQSRIDRAVRVRGVQCAVERRRRRTPVELPDLFEQQFAYIQCPDRWKAIFTARRCGKSYTFGTELWVDALRYPGRQQLYVGLTQAHAERVIYREVLLPAFKAREIKVGRDYSFNRAEGLIEFTNGSSIQLMGGDASPKQLELVLGGRPHRVIADEAQSWTQDLRTFLTSKSWPALADYADDGGGWLEMGGTPGITMGDHFWFQVTKTDPYGNVDPDRLPGWNVFSWPMTANPRTGARFHAEAERRRKAAEGRVDGNGRPIDWQEDPEWRRDWLGQWVLDAGSRVYRFVDRTAQAGGNVLGDATIEQSLLRGDPQWTYAIGLDLGWVDATAWVLVAWRAADPKLYIVRSYKRSKWPYHEIAAALRELMTKFRVLKIMADVSDDSAKQLAASLKSEHQLPIEDAEKRGKATDVGRMNSEFAEGKILVVADQNRELMKEWNELALDPRSPKWAEHEKFDNHLADAALYVWRASLHRFAKAAPVKRRESETEQYEREFERDTNSGPRPLRGSKRWEAEQGR
jgi:hypothetical protein